MTKTIISLIFLILSINAAYADINGRWQLIISGVDRVEFGTERLAGGLNLQWESVLEFSIGEGHFIQGTGTARLLPDIETYSRPEGVFNCNQVTGVFASNSGQSFSTPHLRYAAFPMVGKVTEDKVSLNPYLEYPGNYFAVLYDCDTNNSLGSFWIEQSPRIARELSKRQNALVKFKDDVYSASIKEVKSIPPGPELEVPLVDGFEFSVTQEYGLRKIRYQLHRIGDE